MTIQDQILRKIDLLALTAGEKRYWKKQVSILSDIDLKKIYETLFWKHPAQIEEVEIELQEEQNVLSTKAKETKKRMKQTRGKAEESWRVKEGSPETYLESNYSKFD